MEPLEADLPYVRSLIVVHKPRNRSFPGWLAG
jgi:hypothetical protein